MYVYICVPVCPQMYLFLKVAQKTKTASFLFVSFLSFICKNCWFGLSKVRNC